MTDAELGKMIREMVLKAYLGGETRNHDKAEEGTPHIPVGSKSWAPAGSRGKVPGWVLAATGLETKEQIRSVYGSECRFVYGKPLPAKIGE